MIIRRRSKGATKRVQFLGSLSGVVEGFGEGLGEEALGASQWLRWEFRESHEDIGGGVRDPRDGSGFREPHRVQVEGLWCVDRVQE